MKLAYLTNQYPKVSHTFIRREIAGIEAAGLEVERFSLRSAAEQLVDERDLLELERTRVILRHGALGLMPSVIAVSFRRPVRTLRALRKALALGWASSRGWMRHLAYLAEACVLLRWTEKLEVDHIHVHFASNPATVALLCRDLGGPPFSFTAHGTADFSAVSAGSLRGKIEHACFVVAVCEDGRRRLLCCTSPGQEHKLFVVRCGVDASFLDAAPSTLPGAPRLVCVARLSSEKGIPVLLRAARMLVDDGIAFELLLLGDGPERSALEALAQRLGISRQVHFAGWKSGEEVRACLLDSRALVLPSLSEGLPVVIMEALALRRPVICTSVGGIAELVTTGVCGWVVAPGAEKELADAMRDALTRPAGELEQMGQRGAQRVALVHDSNARARELAQLFLDSRAGVQAAPQA